MARPEMNRVLSSSIFETGYDPASQELWIRFSPSVRHPAGRVGYYAGVPVEIAESFISAPSLGQALPGIKRDYVFNYMD